jgi:hypothetical protein
MPLAVEVTGFEPVILGRAFKILQGGVNMGFKKIIKGFCLVQNISPLTGLRILTGRVSTDMALLWS